MVLVIEAMFFLKYVSDNAIEKPLNHYQIVICLLKQNVNLHSFKYKVRGLGFKHWLTINFRANVSISFCYRSNRLYQITFNVTCQIQQLLVEMKDKIFLHAICSQVILIPKQYKKVPESWSIDVILILIWRWNIAKKLQIY